MSTLSGVVNISFTSDWRCGTGRGSHGGVDLMVARDQEGLPYVPAETVKGLWREACERAAWGLSDGIGDGPWHDLVRHLFGSTDTGDPATARGRVSVRPARLTDDWRNVLADPAEGSVLRNSLVVTRYGVKIADSGVAEDDTLRLMERARAGLTVAAPFQVESWQPDWAVALLLQAGARLWHHTGGSRRRGAGACSVSLTGVTELPALIAQHQTDVAGFALLAPPAAPAASSNSDAEANDATRRAVVTVTTLLPVLSTRSVEGNVARGLPFVPGSSLLPLVARAIGGRATSLIREGRIAVTDAVPAPLLPGGDQAPVAVRLSPLPRTLLSPDKGRAWEVGEALVDALEGVPAGCKAVSGWGAVVDGQWRMFQPRLAVTAHNSIDDDAQRPLDNGLYTFEVIPAGQTLQAEVGCEALTDTEWAAVLALGGERALGRYSSGGYGLVRLSIADVTSPAVSQSPGQSDAEAPALTRFAVYLVSDVLLVDDRGRLAPRADELARQLGNRLAATLRVRASFVSLSRRESWTATRTLPRPSLVGLAAGSVVEFDVTGSLTVAALDAALARGVGTRRAEGFGRLQRLESPPLTMVAAEPAEASSAAPHDPALPKPKPFARLRRASWEAEILRRIQVLAADAGFRQTYVKDGLSRSQLGALREAAIRLPRDREAVQRWVTATEQHDAKSDAWTKERLDAIRAVTAGGQGAAKRLAGVLNNDDTAQPIPSDLGGVPPQVVAAALLAEVLRLAAREGGNR
nr:hypothetical protein [Propionibacterium sp.]